MEAASNLPLGASIVVLLIAITNLKLSCRALTLGIVALASLFGTVLACLVAAGEVDREWWWLIIPYNPLPLIFWRWRRYWSVPYVAIIILWGFMIAAVGGTIVEIPMIIMAWAYAIVLFSQTGVWQRIATEPANDIDSLFQPDSDLQTNSNE